MGPGREGEWVKVRGGGSKRVENPVSVDIKNRFSILERLEDESQIVSQREDGANDSVREFPGQILEWNFQVEGSLGLEGK